MASLELARARLAAGVGAPGGGRRLRVGPEPRAAGDVRRSWCASCRSTVRACSTSMPWTASWPTTRPTWCSSTTWPPTVVWCSRPPRSSSSATGTAYPCGSTPPRPSGTSSYPPAPTLSSRPAASGSPALAASGCWRSPSSTAPACAYADPRSTPTAPIVRLLESDEAHVAGRVGLGIAVRDLLELGPATVADRLAEVGRDRARDGRRAPRLGRRTPRRSRRRDHRAAPDARGRTSARAQRSAAARAPHPDQPVPALACAGRRWRPASRGCASAPTSTSPARISSALAAALRGM